MRSVSWGAISVPSGKRTPGSPAAPKRIASAAWHTSRVSGGSSSPVRR